MSTVTSTSICNSALIKIGCERILSLTDTTRRAILCAEQYPKQVEYCLRSFPWKFARVRTILTPLATPPAFQWKYAFQPPNDFLWIYKTERDQHKFTQEQGLILSNDATMKIIYIQSVTNTNLFDYMFAEAVAWRLAADLSYSLVQSDNLANTMMKGYMAVMAEARSANAQEGIPDEPEVREFIDSRF